MTYRIFQEYLLKEEKVKTAYSASSSVCIRVKVSRHLHVEYVNERILRAFLSLPFHKRERRRSGAIASNDLAEKSTELQFTCM